MTKIGCLARIAFVVTQSLVNSLIALITVLVSYILLLFVQTLMSVYWPMVTYLRESNWGIVGVALSLSFAILWAWLRLGQIGKGAK